MKFNTSIKNSIVLYILEKISQGTKSLSKCVAQTYDISQTTVHAYLNELIERDIIKKAKRGQYELINREFKFFFKRSEGGLDSDTLPYDMYLSRYIGELSENVKEIWNYTLSEMVNNVIDHSEAENMYVVIRQNYLTTSVIITDDGIGIFEKIKNHFSLPDKDAAICELFKGKLTTDKQRHSGEGIFFSSKMMDLFLIYSSGKIFTTSKYENEIVLDVDECISGTRVFMSLSNFSNKSACEVFDLYSNVDGGFTKTKIPMKNVFDSAPVSRSQAKRVCNRLEKFEEVTLDFDGISWMGQGFAHQLFVVYQSSNPQTKIIPINMNESVSNMYNHVLKTT